MSKALVELLKKQFPADVLETHNQRGDETVVVYAGRWKEIARFLRDDPRADMSMLIDLTAVDFPDRTPRFEVVTHLYSLSKGHRLRLKARVGDREGENAEIDTVTDLWASACWAERECWDMFGVRFAGHPDLRRILTYPEFEGHPLRKDYPADRIQPLVPYREVPNIDKIPPFSVDEGMPFGRQTHARGTASYDDDLN
ncbi:MAG TPA: NADH-quinone oxidoreductase subunit C [Polyangiaceae bacterium]